MAKLFLDGIFDYSDYPSTVTISVPQPTGTSFVQADVTGKATLLRGLITGDPTWSAANKWGTILNDMSSLQDWSSLIGAQNQFSWINASTMCWKGTSPLSIGVDFYLINYDKDKAAKLKANLNTFVKLAAVDRSTNGSDFLVQVHGGYAPQVLKGNKSLFDSGGDIQKYIGNAESVSGLNTVVDTIFDRGTGIAKGSLSIRFGNKSTISNLLLAKVNVTESTIEVADQSGGNIHPLYYRVSAQFTGVQPLVTTEVDNIFK